MGNPSTHIENFVPTSLYSSFLSVGKKTYFLLFGLFFLLNFGEGTLFGQTSEPTYEWVRAENMGTVNASNLDNLVISIDTDSQGNVYALTFGNGIEKFNVSDQSFEVIVKGKALAGPLDMVIDGNDIIYVADSDSKTIKKFNTSGGPEGSIGSGNDGNGEDEFWEPTGLAVDNQNNIYIVDSYRGDNVEVVDRYFLKIYYNNGDFKSFQGTTGHLLNNPYRVGVDSNGNIFISHAANNGEVLVFDADLKYLDTLKDIGSPGSIVVDENDFVHVIDYADKLDLSKILDKDGLYFFTALNDIKEGIENEEFGIQIYNPQRNPVKFITNPLDLPLDLALVECEKMYVDDSWIEGNGVSAKLHFELDIFNRTKCGEEENLPPVFENCPQENIVKEADPRKCGAIVTFDFPTAIDDGEPISVTRTDDGPKSGELFSVGTTTVTFEADDGVNPTVECSFKVIVEDDENPVITCIENITKTIPENKDEIVVEFEEPEFSDNCSATIEQTEGLPSGSEFPIGKTTIEYRVTDASGNTAACTFEIVVTREKENLSPVFTNCPKTITKDGDPEKCGAIVTFELPTATDDGESISVTRIDDGPKSGELFSVGTTTVIFEANDGVNPTVECSFDVIVEDYEDPIITCPLNITKTIPVNKDEIVVEFEEPEFSDNCSATIEQTEGLPSGSEFPIGKTTIEYRVADASGNTAACTFEIVVTREKENLSPVFTNCPKTITKDGDPEKCGAIVTFELPTATDDGESISVTRIDDGPKSGELFPVGTTTVIFEADDGVNPPVECSFDVVVKDKIAPTAICASGITLQLNEEGIANLTAEEVNKDSKDNCGLATTEIDKTTFTENDLGENAVILTLTDVAGNTSSCETIVVVEPYENNSTFQCKESIVLELDENGGARLDPEALFEGDASNYTYSVNKENFTCANLGKNKVILTYSGPDGNGSCEIVVVVTDPNNNCAIGPVEPPLSGSFLIVYPNPGRGMVNILTSSDILLEKVEVFDMKMQLLFEKEFAEPIHGNYKLDLRNVQSGVYLLKIYGDDKIYYERVIILRQ